MYEATTSAAAVPLHGALLLCNNEDVGGSPRKSQQDRDEEDQERSEKGQEARPKRMKKERKSREQFKRKKEDGLENMNG